MPEFTQDPRIIIDMLRKERDFLKSDLEASQQQFTQAISRLVKARGLLRRWVTNFENSSGGIRDMELGTWDFLEHPFFTEEQ